LHCENDSSTWVKEHAGYFLNEPHVFGLKVPGNASDPNRRNTMGYIHKAPVVRCFVSFSFIPCVKYPSMFVCFSSKKCPAFTWQPWVRLAYIGIQV